MAGNRSGGGLQNDIVNLNPAADVNRPDPLQEHTRLGVLEIFVQVAPHRVEMKDHRYI